MINLRIVKDSSIPGGVELNGKNNYIFYLSTYDIIQYIIENKRVYIFLYMYMYIYI